MVFDAMFVERKTTRTAERLGMSQPMVSYALAKLRRTFDDELFVREGNAMQPTAFAETLRDPVRRIVETVSGEILRHRAAEFQPATSTRRFTFCLSDIGELVFLPTILETFRREAPGATLRCVTLSPRELEAGLTDGSVDLALGYFPDLVGGAAYQQSLFEHPFAVLLRQEHPSIGHEISLESFLQADHAVVLHEGRSQEIFERRMAELGLARRVLIQSPHFMSVPLIVANSDIITTVPMGVARAYSQMAGLRWVLPPLDLPRIPIKQFWHRRVHFDQASIWLRGLIARNFLGRDPTERPDNPIFSASPT
ncbi:LysR family transcriptional regulator [Novosphingobium rhizosphaerae]|uniref:LysR family transcriptional regulator n=1 Tax=Novosphingobium rhizosphaerae TaxID=1551649 RepID=UPI003D81AE77